MSQSRMTLPNVITVVRIGMCPVIFWLAMSQSTPLRFVAFVAFVAAALSDVWDGWMARKYDLITDLGKLLDPIADKLLLAATLIPAYLISHRGSPLDEVPVWGPMPLWVLVVIFGRELFITLFRSYAARKGVVIAAGASGKRKAMFQMFFIGGVLLWLPLVDVAVSRGWSSMAWSVFSTLLQGWVAITLAAAIVMTVYSMLDYLWSYRKVVGIHD